MASKNVVADMVKGEKLNGDNYDIWRRKIQFVLNEQGLLTHIDHLMTEPEQGTTAQHRRELELYKTWQAKDQDARYLMLSSMENDLLLEFESLQTSYETWEALKLKYGVTSLAKLRGLTLKFDSY